jgi:hypothetical protein
VALTFLSPAAALIFVGCCLPLVALHRVRSKGRRTRLALALPEPRRRWYVLPIAALVTAATLVGLAAAQPVVQFDRTTRVRTDAEAIIAIDTTRSMLARQGRRGPTRLARAKAAALELRQAIPTVPVGIASMTDRTLPYLFPSPDEDPFRATLKRAVGIENPPPSQSLISSRVTRLESLASVATQGFYSPRARERVLVVLTDGESLAPTKANLDAIFAQPPGIRTVLVQFWHSGERVYAGRLPEPGYRPDPTARATLDRFASEVGGVAFSESQLGEAKRAIREDLGSGPTVVRGETRDHVALAPYLAGAAFFPLVLLLWRRDR